MKPVGGTMPVGMKTVSRSSSPPGCVMLISPLVSPVTKTSDQRPLEGNSMKPDLLESLLCADGRDHGLEELLQGAIDVAHDRHAVEHHLAERNQRSAQQVCGKRADKGEKQHAEHEADAWNGEGQIRLRTNTCAARTA